MKTNSAELIASTPSSEKEPRWARVKEICDLYRISPATWWRWSAEREGCPKPRKHGPRVTVWNLNEIDAWLDAQQPKR